MQYRSSGTLKPFTMSFTKVWSLKTSRMFSWARVSIAQGRLKACEPRLVLVQDMIFKSGTSCRHPVSCAFICLLSNLMFRVPKSSSSILFEGCCPTVPNLATYDAASESLTIHLNQPLLNRGSHILTYQLSLINANNTRSHFF